MYQSKLYVSTESGKNIEKTFLLFLDKNSYIYCKVLKRKIFLHKLPEAILQRKSSVSQRLKKFFVSIDITKKSQNITKNIIAGSVCYEIIGYDANGVKIHIHIREEKDSKKNKQLYYVSCF